MLIIMGKRTRVGKMKTEEMVMRESEVKSGKERGDY